VILQDHKDMDAMWQDLHEQLTPSPTAAQQLSAPSAVQRFRQRYQAHMEREESTMAPMACACSARADGAAGAGHAAPPRHRRKAGARRRRTVPAVGDAWPTCARITARPA
jgi:hypothetical protein